MCFINVADVARQLVLDETASREDARLACAHQVLAEVLVAQVAGMVGDLIEGQGLAACIGPLGMHHLHRRHALPVPTRARSAALTAREVRLQSDSRVLHGIRAFPLQVRLHIIM